MKALLIDAVGAGVIEWNVGDAVIASTDYGAFAEQCVADVTGLAALPRGMDFDNGAAFVMTYGSSLHALQQRADLKAGQTLLVLGAVGGVGIAAIEIAKALGAQVLASASTDEH